MAICDIICGIIDAPFNGTDSISQGDWLQVCATIASVGVAYYFAQKQIKLAVDQLQKDQDRHSAEQMAQKKRACGRFEAEVARAISHAAYMDIEAINSIKEQPPVGMELVVFNYAILNRSIIIGLTEICHDLPRGAENYIILMPTLLCDSPLNPDTATQSEIEKCLIHFKFLSNAVQSIQDFRSEYYAHPSR